MALADILQMLAMFIPVLIFVALYIGFWIWGRFANRKKKEEYFDDVLTAIDPYIMNYSRKDPNDRQVEIRCQMNEDFTVTSASAWLIMLPRTSFPTMLVDGLFFRNKDSFGLAANFPEKPRVLFEVIPYRMKSAIRKDFDYLVEIDDLSTPNAEVNENFLIKSNRGKAINQLLRSNTFLKALGEFPKQLQWISVRVDEPHFELKFNLTKEPADLLVLTKFAMTVLKFFAKVTDSTKNLPIPQVLKKEVKKLSEKELKKQEKEKEKQLQEREKRRERARKEEERRAKKKAREEEKARRRSR